MSAQNEMKSDRVIEDDEDVEGLAIELAAEEERKVAALGVFSWEGVALEPYSFSREVMYFTMVAFAGLAPMRVCAKSSGAFLGHAVFLLWLCRMEEEVLAKLRYDARGMVAAAEAWGEVHIGQAKQTQAMDVAFEILSAKDNTRAVHAPSSKGGDSGN